MFVNTAGGIAGGDRFAVDIAAGEGTRLTLTTAAAEKIYRSNGPDLAARHRAEGRSTARTLHWLPQETILFDQARVERRFEIDLAEGASLLLAEIVVFGRAAMGERMLSGSFVDRWRLRRGGRLIFAETMRLDGDIGRKAGTSGGRQRRRGHRHRADRAAATRRWSSGCARRRRTSAARSGFRPGMDLQWRGSVPKMRRGCAPT